MSENFVIKYFNNLLEFKCDIFGKGIGAVLSQEGQLIEYISEKLNEAR